MTRVYLVHRNLICYGKSIGKSKKLVFASCRHVFLTVSLISVAICLPAMKGQNNDPMKLQMRIHRFTVYLEMMSTKISDFFLTSLTFACTGDNTVIFCQLKAIDIFFHSRTSQQLLHPTLLRLCTRTRKLCYCAACTGF